LAEPILSPQLMEEKMRNIEENYPRLKYSFVYIVNGERVIGYDNAEGTIDITRGKEYSYKFQGLEKLWKDFQSDLEQFMEGREKITPLVNYDKILLEIPV